MLISRVVNRVPVRLSQPLTEGQTRSKAEQLVFPLAFILAAAGLSLSTFSLRQLGLLCSKDQRSIKP